MGEIHYGLLEGIVFPPGILSKAHKIISIWIGDYKHVSTKLPAIMDGQKQSIATNAVPNITIPVEKCSDNEKLYTTTKKKETEETNYC